MAPYVFIIDTEQYSGNFEREMCAYITGKVGECGVGGKRKAEYQLEETEDFENVIQEADDRGCYRPCAIWPTPGWFNHGMGSVFPDDFDPALAKEDYVNKVREYYSRYPDSLEKELKKAQEKPLQRYPAYLSVAIFFDKMPTQEQISIMKRRAAKFSPARGEEDIKVTGFRLINRQVVETNIEVSEV